MKRQSFASKRRSPVGRHVVFAGRVLAAIGMIVLLTLTSWSPAMPLAWAQDSAPPTEQPGVNLSGEAPTAPDPNQIAAPDAVTAGGAGYIYALTAKDSKLFYRYDISANTWSKRADIPANVFWGGALTTDGAYIYALSAKDTQGFYRYDIAANTWSARANVPAKVKEGGALTYDGTYVYALTAKDSKLFYRYSNSTDSWSAALTNIPSNVQKTGALNRLGSYIYALPSKDTQFFYRYDIAAGTWATQANVPAKVKEGGALTNDGTSIYALAAKDSKLFYRYDVGANAWTKRADLPAIVTNGGALTYDGAYVYALRAGDSQSFYRYNIAANTWSTQANIPAKVKEGGALVFVLPASSVTLTPNNQGLGVPGQERFYAHTLTVSNLTSVFNLTTTSTQGWTVTVYQDVNGDGDKDPEDTAITATPSIGPNATFKLLVGVQVLLGAGPGVVDTTTVTATADTGGATASATNTTQTAQAGQEITVQPNFTRNVAPGMVSFYGHTVTNNSGQAQQVTITAISSQGWPVLLWEDTNKNGVHETDELSVSNPVSLAPGQTYWLVAEIQTPVDAAVGTVDQTVIRAAVQNGPFGTATNTSTVISAGPPVVDGKYDDIYNTSPNSTVVCYNDSTGKNFGKLASYYVAGSDAVYVVLAIDKDFVDNTYGINAIGWPSGHSFGNLVGSDHALFYGYGANGTKVLDFKTDYITANPSGTTTPSNYSTLGVLGGDGRMNLGSAASIQEWGTSIAYSLNLTGYCTGGNCGAGAADLRVNSPATDAFYTPNTTYPDWIYDVIYELKINTNAFPGGFGRMDVPYIHASPSKIGTNTIIPVPGECPGEIGDYVWHDANRDQVQDSNEQGIDNVRVELYKDDGDGLFEPGGTNGDSFQGFKTTTAGGKYLFQDLKAGNYWVYVVESTVPAGYSTTTYNSPMLVNLGEGESFLDADFGYAIPSTLDYGDAPDTGAGTAQGNYKTVSTDDGPRHTIVSTLKLGDVGPDGDSGFLQNVDATADDLVNIDDEDGVALLPEMLVTSTEVNLTVKAGNSAATDATLACWIDFDRDGQFENNFERAAITVPGNSGTQDYSLTFSNLLGLQAGTSYLRCRIAYDAGQVADATGAAASGEVEDYKVTIGPQPDYGDAPDAGAGASQGDYQTRADDGGPSHVIVADLSLGAVAPDGDNGTLQNTAADADDTTNTDDEDGVTTLPVITNTSTSVPLAVSVTNNTGSPATVACWIDFNRNGVFGDAGERQSALVSSQAGQQTVNLTFTGFGTPEPGDSYLRCRIASSAGEVADSIGAANSGEVEDFKVTILGLDYGDAPDSGVAPTQGSYNTLASNNGPSHVIVAGLSLGSVAPDADPGTLQDPDASADDDTGIDDEDGVETLPSIDVTTTSVPLAVKATNATGANALVACWIDFNRNGLFEIAERSTATVPNGTGTQTVSMNFSGFGTPVAGDSYLRCRIASSATEAGSPTGAANSGEVEDYKITIAAQQLDFGDAPDTGPGTSQGNYNTTASDGGPRHVIVDGLRLGVTAPDGDDGTLQNEEADADDEDNIDDEDGVTTIPVIETTTQEVLLTVLADNNTNANAFLVCWIDFSRDGDFLDGGEKSSQATVPASSGLDDYEVYFTGFAPPVDGQSYLRCRIANDQNDVQSPTGLAQSGEVEDYPVFITPGDISKVGQIGNFVWVDENSDGYQDAGEPGIPNVTVVLYGLSGAERGRTVTDAHGHYLFSNLPGGTYYVDVFDGTGSRDYTLPRAGMEQTPPSTLPGADYGNQDHNQTTIPNTSFTGYRVKLDSGAENLTADFGYNYNTAPCVNGDPSCTDSHAALGDRVWIDANGDGKQDPEEVGLSNVTLTLYHDPDGTGVYDTIYPGGTATTNATGYYIFDGLPPGAYVVRVTPPAGYTQTGDPDLWGAPCSTACDNQTTTPVILAPGDVFLNADFGYQPLATNPHNTIGDKVWFDADADGIGPGGAPGGTDTTEYGIAGVTVALIRDLNNNGIWNATEPIVATDTTDVNGVYLFPGLPDGSYLVWVNDTSNVLAGLRSTYDSDGGVGFGGLGAPLGVPASDVKGISWVQNLGVGSATAVSNLLQDFGYTPINQQPNQGLIGDRVWLDIDGDGVQDSNEPGLEGVVVTLLNSGGVPIGTTTTDKNGYYYFPNLPAGSYTIVVTQPGGMTQTYDADGIVTTPNRSTVTIGGGFPLINLLQDFGYRGTGTVGNLVWEDLNANGVVDGGEAGIPGVTLVLYWDLNGDGQVDPGEPLISHTFTGANGGYLFSGLPTDDGDGNANFVVRVTDDKGLLLGYWHSLGTPKADNNSQTDPYAVTLTPSAPNNLTADFGYYIKAAALGNRVWSDNNSDGIQDATEPGLANVKVTLTIQYFNGPTVTVVTTSGATGFYSFGNLLLDEDHAASSKTGTPAPNQPLYTISTATPSGNTPSPVEALGSTSMNDSDNHAGVDGWATQGQLNVTPNADPNAESNPIAGYDFGFHGPPLAVLLASFDAAAQPDHVLVTWETVSEASNAGFNLYRSLTADGERTLVANVPSQAPGSTVGAAYSFQDFDVAAGQGYWYFLEDIDLSGATALHGPVSVVLQAPTAVTLSAMDADAGQSAAPWLVLLAILALIAAATSVAVRRRVAS